MAPHPLSDISDLCHGKHCDNGLKGRLRITQSVPDINSPSLSLLTLKIIGPQAQYSKACHPYWRPILLKSEVQMVHRGPEYCV